MRVLTPLCLMLAIAPAFAGEGTQKPDKAKKDAKAPVIAAPTNGIRTPGVQIPFASLKVELTFDTPAHPAWIAATDTVLIPSKDGLDRIDPKGKEAKFGTPIAGLKNACVGVVNAFTNLWVPSCGDGTVVRIDAKTSKATVTLPVGTGIAKPGIAATADSVWLFTDDKGTVSRIDPVQNQVVAEFRVFPDCNTLVFGETALWLTCPSENRLLRVDPQTNLVDKSIEVSPRPIAIAIGETSVWVLCEKDGKIDRIDPKTNKVTKTIELGAPATGGTIAIGEGSLWASLAGFPVTRIDPGTEKVVQQFYGDGAGIIQTALGSVWLSDTQTGKLLKLDPRRIAATLAE